MTDTDTTASTTGAPIEGAEEIIPAADERRRPSPSVSGMKRPTERDDSSGAGEGGDRHVAAPQAASTPSFSRRGSTAYDGAEAPKDDENDRKKRLRRSPSDEGGDFEMEELGKDYDSASTAVSVPASASSSSNHRVVFVVPPQRDHGTPRASVSHRVDDAFTNGPPALHAPNHAGGGGSPIVVGGGNLRITAPRHAPKACHQFGPSRLTSKAFTTPPPTPVAPNTHGAPGAGTPAATGATTNTPVAAAPPRRVTISFDEVAEAMQRRLESERRLAGAFGGTPLTSGHSSAVSSAAASHASSAADDRRHPNADIPREVLAAAPPPEPNFLVNISMRQRMAATLVLGLAAVLASLGHVPSVSARAAVRTPYAFRPLAYVWGGDVGGDVPVLRHHPNIIPPRALTRAQKEAARAPLVEQPDDDSVWGRDADGAALLSDLTLRQFLTHPDGFHLAMAPAFFGYYAYFGALTAIDEDTLPASNRDRQPGEEEECPPDVRVLPTVQHNDRDCPPPRTLLKSAAGASAGAMAAVLLSAGIEPRRAAAFASSLNLKSFADPPGWGAALKGDKFEAIMLDYLLEQTAQDGARAKHARLENARIPVAVTGFDIKTMEGRVLTEGCMARAARASATFPGLFQPVGWRDDGGDGGADAQAEGGIIPPSLLIDGGVTDPLGLVGLSALHPDDRHKRVLNMVVGSFGSKRPPGPSAMPDGVRASEVVSVSLVGTPQCGPWAMGNGPKAAEAARRAVAAVMDAPMHRGEESGHYELHVDAAGFVPP